MTHVTCRLTAKNRDQLRNPTLGNRIWATFTFFTNEMIQDGIECGVFVRSVRVKPAKLLGGCCAADVSPSLRRHPSSSAVRSVFSTSTEVYETSHGRLKQRTFMTESVVNE